MSPQPVSPIEVTVLLGWKSKSAVEEGAWARVKRGTYRGDLAYVCRVYDKGGEKDPKAHCPPIPSMMVQILILPRLTPQYHDEPNRKRKKASRPPQALLNLPTDSNKIATPFTGIRERHEYRNGMLLLSVPANLINIEESSPTEEELKAWSVLPDPDIIKRVGLMTVVDTREIHVHDRIRQVSGDGTGLCGRAVEIDGMAVSMLVETTEDYINKNGSEGQQVEGTVLAGHMTQFSKYYLPGDCVKVTTGKEVGKEGFVVSMDNNIVTVQEYGTTNHVCTPLRYGRSKPYLFFRS